MNARILVGMQLYVMCTSASSLPTMSKHLILLAMSFAAPSPASVEDIKGERLADIVRYNAWGIEYADFGAAALRKQPSQSYIGKVWHHGPGMQASRSH